VAFAKLLALARRVREQKQRQRGPKVYSLHAPEVECIGKGKAHRPYEFGVKVSVATTLKHCKGGQFVTHVKALPGNPYDGHTLATVIPDLRRWSAIPSRAFSPTRDTAATRPCRRWPQLLPHHPMAQATIAPNLLRSLPSAFDQSSLRLEFFTDDRLSRPL